MVRAFVGCCDDKKIYLGSDLKLIFNLKIDEVDISTVNFKIVFSVGNKKLTVLKEDMIQIDDFTYLICIKAEDTTKGNLIADVYIEIPDRDFPDGVWRNVKHILTDIIFEDLKK